jgi:hypothetical protein
VAKSQGIEHIDAEVISLSSEISISPSMTTDELREALIDYEKKLFYKKTLFGDLTGCTDLDFSMPGRYDVIYNHILVHKYYLNQNMSQELPFSDALVSWYHNIYEPIIQIIEEERLYLHFPGRTPSDLYVWIVKHWDSLKRKYGLHYAVSDAAIDFSQKYGKAPKGLFHFLAVFCKRIFKGR